MNQMNYFVIWFKILCDLKYYIIKNSLKLNNIKIKIVKLYMPLLLACIVYSIICFSYFCNLLVFESEYFN